MRPGEIGNWLLGTDTSAFEIFANERLVEFFNYSFDGRGVKLRMEEYNKYVENDKDRIRMHGQYYNNIYLGKRIFGPARKQVFTHTIVGGMERRFEIVDNQVNHIPFTHEHSDKYVAKCRNPRIKCCDESRLELHYPSPLLFNDFILTQAPMENTIADFWRMIWQEQVPYIFMLISRKDTSRCAQYWPKKTSCDRFKFHGLQVLNEGIESSSRDPFFRITRIRVIGPDDKELRLEHWQADMNNSENVETLFDFFGWLGTVAQDRQLCTIIWALVEQPSSLQQKYAFVSWLGDHLTSIQCKELCILSHFIRPLVGLPQGFEQDYARWLDERSQRLFVDDFNRAIPAFRLLSPKVDPDLLPLVRRRDRPETRREIHAHVGEMPLPAERFHLNNNAASAANDDFSDLRLPKKYPRGRRY
uniref:Tyrosine-protein phosphatase domain-containing protein n=1 Tax=Ditylenchus dipsaci TaxID=166011 RepID=A0A915DGK8_9BILA